MKTPKINRYHSRIMRVFYSLIFILGGLLSSSLNAQERLHIAVIRVEFQEDQNDLTTGNGRFQLDGSSVPPFTIDPPPHNRSYFEDHLIAVHNYFQKASFGRLEISGRVFPVEQNAAYQLPQEMAFYSPDGTDEENDLGLATLFLDALELADQDQNINFSDYDLVTIVHAGVGKDIDLGFDPTPQDVPSLYISPAFLKRSFGDSFGGVEVDGGSISIDRGIILPETESQEGIQASLSGIFAANIGSHLGLFDLFNPADGSSGVGRFALMDNGLFNAFGLIPALPCAFSRIRAGWDQSVELMQPASNLPLRRLSQATIDDTTVYRVPINNDEYYLLEYRGDVSIDIDSVFSVLAEAREELPSYLEVLQTFYPDKVTVSDSTGVLLAADDYDIGIPGAGILIWHIDDSIVRQKGAANAINDNPDWRAVDLEEADGSQDIGYSYTILEAGYQSEFGTFLDFWFLDNPAPLYQNQFTSQTAPNSRSNRNFAFSNVILKDFSDNSTETMTFTFSRELFQEGFPIHITPGDYTSFGSGSPAGGESVFFTDQVGNIFGISPGPDGVLGYGQYLIGKFSQEEQVSIALADTNQDGIDDLMIAAGQSGVINLFRFEDTDSDSLLDTLRTIQIPDSLTTPPVVRDPYFFIGTRASDVYRFTRTGIIDSIYNFSEAVRGLVISPDGIPNVSDRKAGVSIIDLNSDGSYERVSWQNDELIVDDGSAPIRLILADVPLAAPVFSDIDLDGFYEIIFCTSSRIFVLTHTGSLFPNMPVMPMLSADDILVGSPVVFDINGDGKSEIIAASERGQVFAYTIQGNRFPGFPLTVGGTVTLSPVISDYDDDNALELFALNSEGFLHAWEFVSGVAGETSSWRQASYNFSNNRFIETLLSPVFSESNSLLPAQKVFNYPNPNTADYTNIRYFLREDAKISIQIYDLAGDLVTRLSGPGIGQTYNEVRWNVDAVSSGIYLCRVEAVSASASAVQIIKIMVVN